MKALEVKGLSFSYSSDDSEVVHDLSFSIEEGEYVSLIGHNGSGKSTLAKLVNGLLGFSYRGEISVFGTVLDKKSVRAARRDIGLVFQNPDNQFVGSTVEEDIAFGLENREVPREKMQAIIDEYSEEVGMHDFLKKSPEGLSGGQKQRVAIAGVLAMEPRLLILDEATSMLDPSGKSEILSLIHRLKDKNASLSILSITHDVEEAAKSDRVIVLNAGRKMMEGTPKEVFARSEELASIHLDAPFAYRLAFALRAEGIEVPSDIVDEESLARWICR